MPFGRSPDISSVFHRKKPQFCQTFLIPAFTPTHPTTFSFTTSSSSGCARFVKTWPCSSCPTIPSPPRSSRSASSFTSLQVKIFHFNGAVVLWLAARFFKEGWSLMPRAANKSINFGKHQTVKRIDLAQKVLIRDIIALLFTYSVMS